MLPVSIPGIENLSPAVKYVIAFAIIFVLLALFALILRRLTGGRMSLSNERGRARQPRLGIVDVYDLDRQRQLILLRRDNVEHLLLVGGPNDVVVETNIVRVPGARLPAAPVATAEDRPEPPAARNVEIAPVRPALEAGNGRSQPSFEQNVGSTLGSSDALAGLSGRQGAPSGAALENVLKPNRVVANPNVEPAPVRQAAPSPRPVPPRATPPAAGNEGSSGDMTRQLEAALRRPSPPVETPRMIAPDPKPIPPPPPAMPVPPPPQRVEAAPPPPPRPVLPPVVATPPAPPSVPAPAPARTPPPPPPAEPAPTPAPPQPKETAAPPGPTPSPAKPDPFSIEDIEAEFARLLGRPLEKKD